MFFFLKRASTFEFIHHTIFHQLWWWPFELSSLNERRKKHIKNKQNIKYCSTKTQSKNKEKFVSLCLLLSWLASGQLCMTFSHSMVSISMFHNVALKFSTIGLHIFQVLLHTKKKKN